MNKSQVNFIDPTLVTGLVSTKGDLITTTDGVGLTVLPVGTNGQVLTADSSEATGWKWATAPSTNTKTAFITSNRTFPDNGNEGTTTIGGLNATYMTITMWAGGGGGQRNFGGGGGGSGSAVVGWPIDIQQLNSLSATTFTVVIGSGGTPGVSAAGGNGGNTTVISQDGNNVVSLTGFGGGGGDYLGNPPNGLGGGGGGSGGAASEATGGISNNIGGAAGPAGSFNPNNTGGDITGFWWTGWSGGMTAGTPLDSGSDWFSRSVGGRGYSYFGQDVGGGAGGFNGNGGAATGGSTYAENQIIKSGAANSGAGGAAKYNGVAGTGGSGGCIFTWW